MFQFQWSALNSVPIETSIEHTVNNILSELPSTVLSFINKEFDDFVNDPSNNLPAMLKGLKPTLSPVASIELSNFKLGKHQPHVGIKTIEQLTPRHLELLFMARYPTLFQTNLNDNNNEQVVDFLDSDMISTSSHLPHDSRSQHTHNNGSAVNQQQQQQNSNLPMYIHLDNINIPTFVHDLLIKTQYAANSRANVMQNICKNVDEDLMTKSFVLDEQQEQHKSKVLQHSIHTIVAPPMLNTHPNAPKSDKIVGHCVGGMLSTLETLGDVVDDDAQSQQQHHSLPPPKSPKQRDAGEGHNVQVLLTGAFTEDSYGINLPQYTMQDVKQYHAKNNTNNNQTNNNTNTNNNDTSRTPAPHKHTTSKDLMERSFCNDKRKQDIYNAAGYSGEDFDEKCHNNDENNNNNNNNSTNNPEVYRQSYPKPYLTKPQPNQAQMGPYSVLNDYYNEAFTTDHLTHEQHHLLAQHISQPQLPLTTPTTLPGGAETNAFNLDLCFVVDIEFNNNAAAGGNIYTNNRNDADDFSFIINTSLQVQSPFELFNNLAKGSNTNNNNNNNNKAETNNTNNNANPNTPSQNQPTATTTGTPQDSTTAGGTTTTKTTEIEKIPEAEEEHHGMWSTVSSWFSPFVPTATTTTSTTPAAPVANTTTSNPNAEIMALLTPKPPTHKIVAKTNQDKRWKVTGPLPTTQMNLSNHRLITGTGGLHKTPMFNNANTFDSLNEKLYASNQHTLGMQLLNQSASNNIHGDALLGGGLNQTYDSFNPRSTVNADDENNTLNSSQLQSNNNNIYHHNTLDNTMNSTNPNNNAAELRSVARSNLSTTSSLSMFGGKKFYGAPTPTHGGQTAAPSHMGTLNSYQSSYTHQSLLLTARRQQNQQQQNQQQNKQEKDHTALLLLPLQFGVKEISIKCRIFVLLIHTKALLFTLYTLLNSIVHNYQKQEEKKQKNTKNKKQSGNDKGAEGEVEVNDFTKCKALLAQLLTFISKNQREVFEQENDKQQFFLSNPFICIFLDDIHHPTIGDNEEVNNPHDFISLLSYYTKPQQQQQQQNQQQPQKDVSSTDFNICHVGLHLAVAKPDFFRATTNATEDKQQFSLLAVERFLQNKIQHLITTKVYNTPIIAHATLTGPTPQKDVDVVDSPVNEDEKKTTTTTSIQEPDPVGELVDVVQHKLDAFIDTLLQPHPKCDGTFVQKKR